MKPRRPLRYVVLLYAVTFSVAVAQEPPVSESAKTPTVNQIPVEAKRRPKIREISALGDKDVIVLDNGAEFAGVILREVRREIEFMVVPTAGRLLKVTLPRDRIKRIERLPPVKRAAIRTQTDKLWKRQETTAKQAIVEYKQFQNEQAALEAQRILEAEREARKQAAINAERAYQVSKEIAAESRKDAEQVRRNAEQMRRNAETANRIEATWAPRQWWWRSWRQRRRR